MTVDAGLTRLGRDSGLRDYLSSLWTRRQFALALPRSSLRAQNMDTVLGGLWHLLNPLMLIGVYYLVFGLILDVGERGTDNFIAFLSIGLFTFFYTRKSIQAGSRTLVSNLGLIRSINFPRAVLPVAAVLGETLALAPAIVAMLAIALLTGEQFHVAWLLLVPAFALQFMFNLGAACFVARLTDHFRDVQQIIPYAMTIWLYLSGVFYDVDAFLDDKTLLRIFKLNPMYAYVELVRDAILEGGGNGKLWVSAAVWSLASLVAGFTFFRRREQAYGRA